MSTSPAKKTSLTHDIPLANLFAYIRDLYHTSDPVFRFEDEGKGKKIRNQSWWALADWQRLAEAGQVEFQWQSPDHPILSVQRLAIPEHPPLPADLQDWVSLTESYGESPQLVKIQEKLVPFDSHPKRLGLYREFYQQVHQKTVEEVGDLNIPSLLQNFVEIQIEDGKVLVTPLQEGLERFEEDDLREELLIAAQRVHAEHYQAHSRSLMVNQLFDALHAAHFELKAHGEQRLFLSFGLVQGKLGQETYRNFLFHIPLRLEIKKQELQLFPDTFAQTISCEQSFTELMEQAFPNESEFQHTQRQTHVLRLIDQFHQEPHEFNLDAGYLRHSFYETGRKILEIFPDITDEFFDNKALNWSFVDQFPKEGLSFSFSPVVHARMVESHEHIAQDASRIIEKINELSSLGESDRIPDFFKKLFSLRRPEHKLRIAYKTENRSHLDLQIESEVMPDRLLFPLPSNKEQRAIAERLATQDAVTVMGPPGTGKSHTIANLTSHFVAQGKSVLIVSRYAKALEVIRGKLPGGIRNLAVSFNQQDPQQDALKHAIDAIKENLSRPIDPLEIEQLQADLDHLESQYRELMEGIVAWMSSHHNKVSIHHPEEGNITLPVAELAERYLQPGYEQSSLKDPIPDSMEELATSFANWTERWASLLPELEEFTWPAPERFPDPQTVSEVLREMNQLSASVDEAAYLQTSSESLRKVSEEAVLRVIETRAWLGEQTPWMLEDQFDSDTLTDLLKQLERICAGWEQESRALLPYSFYLDPLVDTEWETWKEESRLLWDKLNNGLNRLQKTMLPKLQKRLLECKVNGRAIEQTEQLGLVIRAIDQKLRHKQWFIALQNYLALVGESLSEEEVESWRRKLTIAISKYSFLGDIRVAWREDGILVSSLQEKDDSGEKWLNGISSYLRLKDTESNWQQLIASLPETGQPHEILGQIAQYLESQSIQEYTEALDAYQQLLNDHDQLKQWREEQESWETLLPETTGQFLEEKLPVSASDLMMDAFHIQVKEVVAQALEESDTHSQALKNLGILQQEIEHKIAELITLKTWQRKQQEVSDEQKSALSAWRNDLINIGKGYGKNTERNMASAVTNMQLAKGAVPIWIMQQDTAITFFPEVDPGAFDLLIVDEASQCDISTLNLIFRSKKCIIVGDENQTSVATQASMFPIDRTNQLLDRYLVSHPFKQQFNINNRTASIYTLSGVIYPNIVTLREHFRCRPELIGFSNQYVYDNQIVPLRTATDNQFGSPLEAHHVEDDASDRRRPQLVRQAVQLIADLVEDYHHQQIEALPTVGILTLDSSYEEHRELLIRELARHPGIKEYSEELNLLVGTSREFQGDERDVMILTSTASHKYTDSGELRPPRAVMGEEMMRIYNVAISRARDKVILLYNAHPESVLKMNEGCFRRRMIEYCTAGGAGASVAASTASQQRERMTSLYGAWAAEMLDTLSDRIPDDQISLQHRVGPYLLDLALISEGKKMGILIDGVREIDGPQSASVLQDQLTLERAGWSCIRISELDWKLNAERMVERILAE